MKARAISITDALAQLPMLKGRRPDTAEADVGAAFAVLSAYDETAGIFTGSFSGQSAWERHPMGDELVQVIDGSTELQILTGAGRERLELKAGMLTVVPKGQWHRFNSAEGVSLMTITPQPTDHSRAENPALDEVSEAEQR